MNSIRMEVIRNMEKDGFNIEEFKKYGEQNSIEKFESNLDTLVNENSVPTPYNLNLFLKDKKEMKAKA